MRRRILELAAAAALGVFALAIGQPLAQAQAVKARLGHAMAAGHPQAVAMKKFAEDVGKATNGRVQIQVFDGAILGSDDKLLQAAQGGTLEFYIGGVAPLSGKIKEVQIFDFPFLFADRKEVDAVLNGPIGQRMLDRMADIGLVGLSWNEFGFRNFTNSKRPVASVSDMEGLKARVMQNPVALDSWKALGSNAVTMSFSEVFTALETKALDGQENPLQHIYANRIHEVQKYITLTNHVYTPVALIASKKWMDGLQEADRKAVLAAAREASAYQAKLIAEGDVDVIEKLRKAGVVINILSEQELAKMREKTKPVAIKYTESIGADFVREFLAAIETARSSKK